MYYRTLFLCLLSMTILANRAFSLDGKIEQQDDEKKINQKDNTFTFVVDEKPEKSGH